MGLHSVNPADRYLQQLSRSDLLILAEAAGAGTDDADAALAHFRDDPSAIESALFADDTFRHLFGERTITVSGTTSAPAEAAIHEGFSEASPFLLFAVAVHRGVMDLHTSPFVSERVGAHRRIPIFDAASILDYYVEPSRRLFAAEHLASYTQVRSGPVWVRHNGKLRRQRYSELDPARLAALLDVLPDEDKVGIYRRLGDLALFLTGVFGDHTAREAPHPIEVERLIRTVRDEPDLRLDVDEIAALAGGNGRAGLLSTLGPRWYRMAADRSPLPAVRRALHDVAEGFDTARRFLTLVTDRYLFGGTDRWFGTSH
ncbi:MAG: hypothetical protein S0880_06680 [Actinomycetota bacterium]|nr:hypothetical protein [Actinomycetota bacterium]